MSTAAAFFAPGCDRTRCHPADGACRFAFFHRPLRQRAGHRGANAAIDAGGRLPLNADFDIQFSPRLEEAVTRGVPLYFVVEFELSRPRWYWFDEKPVKQSQTFKITYTPLLRQYRLSVGNLYQNFTRFDEVKRVLSRVRGWHVADKGAVKAEGVYQANLRLRLDTGQLPKPFQLNAVASSDWSLNSEWHRWTVNP